MLLVLLPLIRLAWLRMLETKACLFPTPAASIGIGFACGADTAASMAALRMRGRAGNYESMQVLIAGIPLAGAHRQARHTHNLERERRAIARRFVCFLKNASLAALTPVHCS
jgi:hypothetical protein